MAGKRSSYFRKILFVVVFFIGFIALGYAIGKLIKGQLDLSGIGHLRPEGYVEWILFWLLLFFTMWFVIAVHELGHLLAGLVQGFRFGLFAVGPLGAKREGRRVKFYWNTDVQTMGGLAATFPKRYEQQKLASQFARVVLAGPLTSLVYAVLTLILAWLLNSTGPPYTVFLKLSIVFLGLNAFMSTMIFLFTAVPLRSKGGFMSDGARWLNLTRGGPAAACEQATLAALALLAEGKRYGELPEDLIDQMEFVQGDSAPELGALSVVMQYYMEQNEPENAAPYAHRLAAGLEASPALVQNVYGRDLLFYYAFFEKNKEQADQWMALTSEYNDKAMDGTTFKLKAAMALLDGRYHAVPGLLEQSEQYMYKHPLPGLQRVDEYWLQQIRETLQAHPVEPGGEP